MDWIGSDVFGNGEKILVLLEFSRENHHFLEGVKVGLICYLGGDFFNWVFWIWNEWIRPGRRFFHLNNFCKIIVLNPVTYLISSVRVSKDNALKYVKFGIRIPYITKKIILID